MLDVTVLPLQTDRVRIRALRPEDADAFAAGTADTAVRTYAHLPEPRYSPDSARAMSTGAAHEGLQRGDLAVLAIADATTDAFAGSVVLFDVAAGSAEVGFWLHPDYRGAGFSQAALDLAGQFARHSGLRQLTARTAIENTAAQQVLRRSRFDQGEQCSGTAPSGATLPMVHYTRALYHAPELPISTERLSLRAHRTQDARWLQRIYSQAEVARYLLEEPWTAEDAGRQVEQRLPRTDLYGPTGALGLVIESQHQPVGDVALWLTSREQGVAEIGWVLDPKHQGQGLAAEAVRAILAIGFEHYQLHRVTAEMDARNTASARLAEAVGMQHEGHLRQNWWSKGEWTDTLIYAMLRGDRD